MNVLKTILTENRLITDKKVDTLSYHKVFQTEILSFHNLVWTYY